MHRRSRIAIVAYSVLALSIIAAAALGGYQVRANRVPRDTVSTYVYNEITERWVKTVESTPVPKDPDGTQRAGSHTIEIRLDEHNPVKELIIQEALIINRGDISGQPLLEIVGHESGLGDGKINIGKLAFKEVDAERLRIDADIVRTTIENVVAKDNELDLDLNVVNVVRTGRGAASSLFIGVSRIQTLTKFDNFNDVVTQEPKRGLTSRETGIRVDRIRIIGPSTGTAFIEMLVVLQSSVFGDIEVRDVEVQDLIIRDVSLDDSF